MQPVDVRRTLADALDLDLVGPAKGSALEGEVLPQSPSRWYLTGFLVPLGAKVEQRTDETAAEEVDALESDRGADDGETPEPPSARRAYFPSSIGISLMVRGGEKALRVTARWGDYRHEPAPAAEADPAAPDTDPADRGAPGRRPRRRQPRWSRTQREAALIVPLPDASAQPQEHDVPGSGGLKVVVSARQVPPMSGELPAGTRSVSVFLVNHRPPAEDEVRDEAFAFQAELEVCTDQPLVPRPNLLGLTTEEWDERVADLQYHDAYELAVGHGVSATALEGTEGDCHAVRTCWIPRAQVERVAPTPIPDVELRMEALAAVADADEAKRLLQPIVTHYRGWIEGQAQKVPAKPKKRKETGDELLARASRVAARIEQGIEALSDPQVLEAFRIANRTMAAAARRRFGTMRGRDAAAVQAPTWRPFQLAFVLMNIPGVADPAHDDREVVDLLFFPTGGGKTEAYLGLAAVTLVLRRLRNPGIASAGVTVLMRYTLRLLTLDQLGRAATLVCALELERRQDEEKLGPWPFEIGLWVGRAATPNRMGKKGDNDRNSARAKTIAFKNDDRKPSPIPLEECPWCGAPFKRTSFTLVPNADVPRDLRVVCANRDCDFTRDRPLPILGVDEPIYRRLPCFLIATVDKFAAMPWTGPVGGFFGRVERYDRDGFYGPCDPAVGQALPGGGLHPPELVIQDELHLISGPMGTLVGLYETALDELSTRQVDGKRVRPKIVASTATVRRAEKQIRALFNRYSVDVFPPPGPNRRDSFFAEVHRPERSHARLYVGVAAQGRSPKVALLRTYLALLSGAQKAWVAAGGAKAANNPADPYMTLLGYFNSLRELGGTRRIIEEEVTHRLATYAVRKRENEPAGLFADRKIAYDVVELTSRVSTDKVAEAKRRLAQPFVEKDRVDVAIATNMISVGLDITRLGLMVVFGQPKTSAEYIQSTSRVGRDPELPGLVVTLLNIHRPRDRSHYERFTAYHETFYRSVEATSVTPFSPRALDRALTATLVSLARLGDRTLTPPLGASAIEAQRSNLDFAEDALVERARSQPDLSPAEVDAFGTRVRNRVRDLLDEWSRIAHDYHANGVQLQYQVEEGGAQRLLYDFLDPELKKLPPRHRKFRANRSMRDVEASVYLWVRTLDDIEVEEDDA